MIARFRRIRRIIRIRRLTISFFAQTSSLQIIRKARMERILSHCLVIVPKKLKLFDITAPHDAIVVKSVAPRLHTARTAHHERHAQHHLHFLLVGHFLFDPTKVCSEIAPFGHASSCASNKQQQTQYIKSTHQHHLTASYHNNKNMYPNALPTQLPAQLTTNVAAEQPVQPQG